MLRAIEPCWQAVYGSGMGEPKTYTAKIRLEVVMEYETSLDPYPPNDLQADTMRSFLEESHCVGNIVRILAIMAAGDETESLCNICRFSKVTLLPQETVAYGTTPTDRWPEAVGVMGASGPTTTPEPGG